MYYLTPLCPTQDYRLGQFGKVSEIYKFNIEIG